MRRFYEQVLSFWFGELDERGIAAQSASKRWWKKDEAFDRLIVERFEAEHAAVLAGERSGWLAEPRGRLAAIIVLDQLSRNMYRGTPGMFAADAQALQWSLEGIEQGMDRALAIDERAFFYMPLQHAESRKVQAKAPSE